MKCPSCKKYTYQEGDRFCEHCGNVLPPRGAKLGVWDPKRARPGSGGGVTAVIYLMTTIAVLLAIAWLCLWLTGMDDHVKSLLEEKGILRHEENVTQGADSGGSSWISSLFGGSSAEGTQPAPSGENASLPADEGQTPAATVPAQTVSAETTAAQNVSAQTAAAQESTAPVITPGIGRVVEEEPAGQEAAAPAQETGGGLPLWYLVSYAAGDAPGLVTLENAGDILGNRYERAIAGSWGGDYRNEGNYYLWGEYTTLTGMVVRGEGTNPDTDLSNPSRTDLTLRIMGDGVLLYESASVTLAGNEMQMFTLDVSGVNVLNVSMLGAKYIRLVNVELK